MRNDREKVRRVSNVEQDVGQGGAKGGSSRGAWLARTGIALETKRLGRWEKRRNYDVFW